MNECKHCGGALPRRGGRGRPLVYCGECAKVRAKENAKRRKADDIEANKFSGQFISKHLWKVKTRAKKKGLAYNLDDYRYEIAKRIRKGRCEMTGIVLVRDKEIQWNSLSLDRIDNSKGYTYDNIRVICYGMNAALGRWGEEALEQIVRAWLKERKNQRKKNHG